MISKTFHTILLFCICSASCLATKDDKVNIENEKINYSTGYQLGSDFKRQGMKLSSKLLVLGLLEANANSQSPLMTPKDMRIALAKLQQQVEKIKQKKDSEIARSNQLKGKQYLLDNAKKDGVISLRSGLQYKIIKPGTGRQPQKTSSVTVKYRGTLLDGTEFDSSSHRKKDAIFKVDRVIRGWTQALQMMAKGSRWQLYIPPKLGFGESPTGNGVPPNSTLLFDLELIAIN
jgi:FKBP-type peptidyl-prolyl cis-trans isomerase FklB